MNKKNNWQVYTRGEIPIYRLMPAFTGIYRYRKEYPDYPLRVAYSHLKDKLWWAWDRTEIEHFWHLFIRRMGSKHLRRSHFKGFDKAIKQSNVAVRYIRSLDLKKLSTEKLLRSFDYLHREGDFAHMLMSSDIDAFDLFFNDHLYTSIKNFLREKISTNEEDNVYTELTQPYYQSYLSQQNKKIYQLSLQRQINAKIQANKLNELFWWTSLGWESMRPHTPDYFLKKINQARKLNNGKIKLLINSINKETSRIKKQRAKILLRFNFSKEILDLVDLMDNYVKYHDLRKEMQVKSLYASHLLLREVGRRRRLAVDLLEWMTPEEVKSLLLEGKFDSSEVNLRRESMFVLMDKNGIRCWSGEKAKKIHKQEFDLGKVDIKILKGIGASKGEVKGRVKVCSGAAEALKKVKKYDILVCGMTLPDYIVAMRKAAAIVTDEGGITCHAAIISRELGIPCVIGTKIATQVLKDGDKVEVDATNGIIKII